MTDNKYLEKLEQLQLEENLDNIEQALKNEDFFHPLFFHVAVEKFVQSQNIDKALYYASFGSDFIKKDNGKYFGSIYSNSIGTMLAFPLIKWKINSNDTNIIFRILASSYIYLTAGINLSGINAYDSLRTRGILLNKYSSIFSELAIKYVSPEFSLDKITELIICDKYYTSMAFKSINTLESYNALESAMKLMTWYNQNFDETAIIEDVVEKGKTLHQVLHNGLLSRLGIDLLFFEKKQYQDIIQNNGS